MSRRVLIACAVAALVAPGAGVLAPSAGASSSPSAAGAALAPPRQFVADASPTWQTDETVYALATADGVVYAGGAFQTVRPPKAAPGTNTTPRLAFAAFDATSGGLLPCAPSFGLSGDVAEIRALTVSADGSLLYVGGRFDSVNSQPALNLTAIRLATCAVVRGLPRVDKVVHAIAATSDAVYVGGDFTKFQATPRLRLAAMTPQGALLPWAPSADDRVRALTVAPGDTRVYAGGRFSTVNGSDIDGIVALNPTSGAVVQSFPGWIDASKQEVKSLAHDDTNFYLGSEGTGSGQFDGRIAADVQTGQLRWRDNCLGATQAVLPHDGLLYSASHAHNCSTTPGGYPDNAMQGRQHFLAQDIADSTIQPWFPDTNEGPGYGVGPYALTVADDVLWAGGMFTTVNNRQQQGLTRFPTGPDKGAPEVVAKPTASGGSTGVTVTWRGSWDKDDGVLTYRLYRDGGSTPITTLSADSRYWSRPTLSFTDSGVSIGTHTYQVSASDGPNTSALSDAVSINYAVNLIPGSATSQSSTAFSASSSRAADGNTDGVFNNGSVTHTNFDSNPWWQADLGSVRTLSSVVIWNRTDCCSTRLGSFDVFLSANPFTSTDPNATRNQPGVTTVHVGSTPNPSVTLPVTVGARYLRVQISGSQYLSLAEVQAFG